MHNDITKHSLISFVNLELCMNNLRFLIKGSIALENGDVPSQDFNDYSWAFLAYFKNDYNNFIAKIGHYCRFYDKLISINNENCLEKHLLMLFY